MTFSPIANAPQTMCIQMDSTVVHFSQTTKHQKNHEFNILQFVSKWRQTFYNAFHAHHREKMLPELK